MAKSVGRPPADLEPNLRIFEVAVAEGIGITKALEKANIKSRTYYDYLAVHPEYAQKIRLLKNSLEEVAECALSKQLETEPKDDEHRKEIAELAKWVIENRKRQRDSMPALPMPGQIQGGQHIMLNFGNQITAEEMQEFNDDELELVRSGAKTFDQIRAEKKLGKTAKIAPQHS